MRHASLQSFLAARAAVMARGPFAVIMLEDPVEIGSTIRHHQNLGFRHVIVLAPPALSLPEDLTGALVAASPRLHLITDDPFAEHALPRAVNMLASAAPGQWFYYGYNAEYLFFPFCETRRVGEMLNFHTEEKRDAMLCYVIDLYADDLSRFPDAVSLEHAHFDRAGYFAQVRGGEGGPKERQLDFFGALRWRFEEHVAPERRRIDRIALFRADPQARLRPDYTLTHEEMNTYASPWHNNLTAAICSFRAAKALRTNPGSRHAIGSFLWRNSERFRWDSHQLMDLGLMEPGQWF
jgi:hypothetical protein